MNKRKTARKRKTALKKKIAYIYAVLTKKRTVIFQNEIYDYNVPKLVEMKTARLLKMTGFFEFEKVRDEDKRSDQERQEENKEK